ncbi:MAG: hypothetical protein AAF211_26040, partial [Myxococcota bacterium]
SIDRSQKMRDSAFDEDLAWLDTYAAKHAKGKGDRKALQGWLQNMQRKLPLRPAAVQQAVARTLIDLKLDESALIWDVPGTGSINEWAIFTMVQTCNALRDREGVLTWSQTYLDRYPGGQWFQSVKYTIDQVIQRIETEREARASNIATEIEARYRFEMQERRCEIATIPKQRAKACRGMLEAAAKAPEVDWDDVFDEVLEGAADAGDLTLADDALAALRRHVKTRDVVEDAEEDVADLRERTGTLDRVEKEFDAAVAKSSRSFGRYFTPFEKSGAYERALGMAERIPDPEQRAEQRWELLVDLGRVDELKRIHAAVMNEPEPFLSESRRTSTIERLERDAGFFLAAESERKADVADDLASAGLHRDAAELYDRLIAENLDDGWLEPQLLLLRAGSAWGAVFEPDAPGRARAYWQRILDEYGDTEQAEMIPSLLKTLR